MVGCRRPTRRVDLRLGLPYTAAFAFSDCQCALCLSPFCRTCYAVTRAWVSLTGRMTAEVGDISRCVAAFRGYAPVLLRALLSHCRPTPILLPLLRGGVMVEWFSSATRRCGRRMHLINGMPLSQIAVGFISEVCGYRYRFHAAMTRTSLDCM